MRSKWLLSLLPIAFSLLVALVLRRQGFTPVVYVKADLGTITLMAGFSMSVVVAILIGLEEWNSRFVRQIQNQAAIDRRRFLSRLDHELKNPLTAIRAGLANLAEAPAPDDLPEDRQEALASVEAQTLRLSRLSADLRKLAELETRTLERTPVNIGELLEEVFNLAEDHPAANERRLVLTIPRAPWPLPHVSGDRDLLFLAVHNLIDNAMKFTRPGDTIEIRAFEDGSMVAVEVADTGPGIPEDDLPHIWEELYRGKQARGIPGSGLGLALVRAISDRHGGRLTVRSRAGQGTVFTLRLQVR